MRSLLVVGSGVVLAACTSTRARLDGASTAEGGMPAYESATAAVAAPAPAVASTTAPPAPLVRVAPATSMWAMDLAKEQGLSMQDVGGTVLLSSDEVRARFYSGEDCMTLDGVRVP